MVPCWGMIRQWPWTAMLALAETGFLPMRFPIRRNARRFPSTLSFNRLCHEFRPVLVVQVRRYGELLENPHSRALIVGFARHETLQVLARANEL